MHTRDAFADLRKAVALSDLARANDLRNRVVAPECWLNLNGWGEAGYMDGGAEQAAECTKLRANANCPMHSVPTFCDRWDGCKLGYGHDGICFGLSRQNRED